MKIYTKKGDDGTTGLVSGVRVSKSHLRVEAYGNIDELNSHIGLLRDMDEDTERRAGLKSIQDRLFTIGALLATPENPEKYHIPEITEDDINTIEKNIDKLNDQLPVMKNFILPGGNQLISYCHITRCVCRRAERSVVLLKDNDNSVPPRIIHYLNRLSDYLFVLGRFYGQESGVDEIPWKAQ